MKSSAGKALPVKERVNALLSETLFRNSLYLMLTTATMAVLGFLFWLLVAHLFRPSQVGVASTLISAMNFIANVSLLGLNSTLIRFLPRSKHRNEQIDTSLLLVALGSIMISLIFAVAGPYFSPHLALLHRPLYAVGFMILCFGAAVNLITDSVFIAYRAAGYNLIVDGFIGSGIQLVLPFALIGLGAFGIFAAQGAAALLAMIYSLYFMARKFGYRVRPKLERSVIRHLRYYSLRSYVSILMTIVPTIVVPIIVLNRLGPAVAGYYYMAYMMANMLFAVAHAVAQSLFAEGSYGDRELAVITRHSAKFLAALMLPASAAMVLVGPLVLEAFGPAYGAHGREAVIVLACAGPFMAALALATAVLNIVKAMRTLIVVNTLDALIVCLLAWHWAGKGLAWVAAAWVVGHGVAAVLSFAALGLRRRRYPASAHMPA